MKTYLLALCSVSLLGVGCQAIPSSDQAGESGERGQNGLGWNGLGWNGLGWNGLGWNGLGWNGLGWNGLGWNGLGWNGLGWNGISFTGIGVSSDWGMLSWVNSDVDGIGGPTQQDRDVRIQALDYWTNCACPSGVNPVWSGYNPYNGLTESFTMYGNLGLAPTWCSGTSVVPVSERQAVSACLISRINMKGIHNALSIRGYENSLKLEDNEALFMAYKSASFWGDLWETSPSYINPSTGKYQAKARAYGCYHPWGNGNADLARDLQGILGRTCEWDGCGGNMKTLRACGQSGDGAVSQEFIDPLLLIPSTPSTTADGVLVTGGGNNAWSNGYYESSEGDELALFRGESWRKLTVNLGAWADLEVDNWKKTGYSCGNHCKPIEGGSCADYSRYGRREGGEPAMCEFPSDCNPCQSVVWAPFDDVKLGISAPCVDVRDCVRGRKLVDLHPSAWLRIQFTRPYDLTSLTPIAGTVNPHKAGTLSFWYSNGNAVPLSIKIRDNQRNIMLPGHGFTPTGGAAGDWDKYERKMIYPIFPSVPVSATDLGVDISIAKDVGSPGFPHLDHAQIFVGPPPGVAPIEQYDDGNALVQAIPQDPNMQQFVTALVQVGNDGWQSSFQRAPVARFRVIAEHPDMTQLAVTVRQGGSTHTFLGSQLSPGGWTPFVSTFANEDVTMPYEVQVTDIVPDGLDGILRGVVVQLSAW